MHRRISDCGFRIADCATLAAAVTIFGTVRFVENIARPSWPGTNERDFRLSVRAFATEPKWFGYVFVFNRAGTLQGND
jgi:hypothetical protein